MSGFMGGSAFAMARELAEGFITVNARSLGRMSVEELRQLSHEIERLQRELRGTPVTGVEQAEVQRRNRRLQRLTSTMLVLRHAQQAKRRGGRPVGR